MEKELNDIIIESIKRDVELQYYVEVSGAIEYLFRKHNGCLISNILASDILQIDESHITLSKVDNVHYDRPIGLYNEVYTKVIFGIKNEEVFQKVIEEVENYGSFIKTIKQINESIDNLAIKQAIYIIENIYRAHEEDGYNELIPSWHEALIKSLKILREVPNKNETIEDYIGYCEYLLDDMQLLEMNILVL